MLQSKAELKPVGKNSPLTAHQFQSNLSPPARRTVRSYERPAAIDRFVGTSKGALAETALFYVAWRFGVKQFSIAIDWEKQGRASHCAP
jgi:hypothetical protein